MGFNIFSLEFKIIGKQPFSNKTFVLRLDNITKWDLLVTVRQTTGANSFT
jgi:hypothetical protein